MRFLDPSSRKTPFIYISIQLEGDQLDVNLEPSKMAVMLHHKQDVIDLFQALVHRIYGSPIQELFGNVSQSNTMIEHHRLDQESTTPSNIPENSINHQTRVNTMISAVQDDDNNLLDNANTSLVPREDQHEFSSLRGTNNDTHEERPTMEGNVLIEKSTNMDIDISSNSELQQQLQQREEDSAIGLEDEQDQLIDENNDAMQSERGVWEFSMSRQGSSMGSSSSSHSEGEQDQLLPSEDDEDDLILPEHDLEPHVPTLSEWLKAPQQQQQPPQVNPIFTSSPSSSSFSRVPTNATMMENTNDSVPNRSNNTQLLPQPTTCVETSPSPAIVPTSRRVQNPRVFINPLITTSRRPVQQRDTTSSTMVSSSSSPLTTTNRPPTVAFNRCRIHNPTPKGSGEKNHVPERLFSILQEGPHSQIDPDPLDEQSEYATTSMTIGPPQQQSNISSTEIYKSPSLSPPAKARGNRNLYDMFRMQSLTSPPETTLASLRPQRSIAVDKGKNVVRPHRIAQDTSSQSTITSHQSTTTPSAATATTLVTTNNPTHNIPRKRKRNTLFSDHRKKSALFDTLNLTMPVQCNSFSIYTKYPSQYQRLARYHRVRLDCYPTMQGAQNTMLRQFPLSNQGANRLSLVAYAKQQNDNSVKEIGVATKDW
ncbi:hypothetical protein BDA99DRAFT_146764 [Phascolomyces articulosus]|uniref:DNA mismatch repair protein S5 domain-containing protein n=1 Tax=Phascolomyces articulosus TaxID=60185 RepID=A0AAD5PBQ2_9FUNG|nr:hypothetical protein BDA99DRAFT_146764 [Phascolomyces articulosus]